MFRPLIDEDGEFTRGKHEGESVSRVARRNPGYLHFLLETANVGIDDKDREMIQALLQQYGHLPR